MTGREGNVRVACRYIISISADTRACARLGEVRSVINAVSDSVKNILLQDKARYLNLISKKLHIRNLFLDRVTKCIEITSDDKFKNTTAEHVIRALEKECQRAYDNKLQVSCYKPHRGGKTIRHILCNPYKCSKITCQAHYCLNCCSTKKDAFNVCTLCSTSLYLDEMTEGEPSIQHALMEYELEMSSSLNDEKYERFIVNEIDLCYKMKLNGPKSYSNTKVVSKEECMRLKKKERVVS